MATDYEKKYKEALERAKKFEDKYGGDYAGYIFPELAESEDERIRRKMIEHFKAKTKETWCNMPVKDIIAYLEKQKEHSMSAEEVLIRAGLKLYKDGNQWFILSGDIIQEGICGFGFTIDEALYVFLKEVLIMANSPQLKEQKQEKFPPYVTGIKGDPDPAGVWKPSEEQMEALNEIVNILEASPFLHQNDYLFNILNGLREELKNYFNHEIH